MIPSWYFLNGKLLVLPCNSGNAFWDSRILKSAALTLFARRIREAYYLTTYSKKLNELLKPYIGRVGESKLKMILNALGRKRINLKPMSRAPISAKKIRQETEIENLEALWKGLKNINALEVIHIIKEKNVALVVKFRLITNLAAPTGSQEPTPPEYIM
jgi:hypothetical protein